MKLVVVLGLSAIFLGLSFGAGLAPSSSETLALQDQAGKTPPDVLKLGADSKLGAVNFSHTNHITKNYNIAGTGPVDCVECHHAEQPAAEVAKHPPLQTAWPADRTTTLTAASVKDAATPPVTACRSCHAKKDEKPKVWPTIPEIKHEGSAAMITLTNQQAFHRNCASCHDEVMKQRPTAKAPKTAQCTVCHKKTA